jgi:hypothetical protein
MNDVVFLDAHVSLDVTPAFVYELRGGQNK